MKKVNWPEWLVAFSMAVVAITAFSVLGVLIGDNTAHAEITVANGPASPSPGTGIVVTNTAATTALDNGNGTTPFTSTTIQNCSSAFQAASPTPTCATATSQNVYVRLFWCGEPVTAASAASGTTSFLIAPGEYATFTYDPNETHGLYGPGYCRVSLVTASGTARVTIVSK
jgi:hypothetical protein